VTVVELHEDHGSSEKVAQLAQELDGLYPWWWWYVDVTRFERGEIDTSPLAQVRAHVVLYDENLALVLSAMQWERGHPEEWHLPRQWRLWHLAWRHEVDRRRAS
jgi:hypothetical protein